jgi:nucleoside-diphosphate-sugar epimerase
MTDNQRIEDVQQLEEGLSRPTEDVIATMGRIEGHIIILGVGGKIGPTLAMMARRASDVAGVERRIIGVARFSSPELRQHLNAHGIETIACDLLDRAALESLPKVPNVFYLAAKKFGSTGAESTTWAMNVYLPGLVCEKFTGSRIVAYSTGNVYPLVPTDSSGATEATPTEPVGDYAMSCLGRERIFSHFSETRGTPVSLVRLNYATELRYGTLVDIAGQVLAGEPIDLSMGYFNAVWQGDSNAMTLRALDHVSSPPFVVNLAGPEKLSIRECAEQLGQLMNKTVTFTGTESPDAFLSDGRLGYEKLGHATVGAQEMMRLIADWQLRGGSTLGKPTHFQTRDGKF